MITIATLTSTLTFTFLVPSSIEIASNFVQFGEGGGAEEIIFAYLKSNNSDPISDSKVYRENLSNKVRKIVFLFFNKFLIYSSPASARLFKKRKIHSFYFYREGRNLAFLSTSNDNGLISVKFHIKKVSRIFRVEYFLRSLDVLQHLPFFAKYNFALTSIINLQIITHWANW